MKTISNTIATRMSWIRSGAAVVSLFAAAVLAQPAQANAEWSLEDQSWDLMELFFGTAGKSPETHTQILTVESDAIPGTNRLEIARDASGVLTSLIYITPEKQIIAYTLSQLHERPQILKQMDGHDVILVSVENDFSATQGGHANMRYLTSGISGSYKNFRMLVDVQGASIVLRGDANPDDPESDENPYTSVFNYLFLAKNTFFGKVIGIDKVLPEKK